MTARQVTPLYIAGCGTWLPPVVTVEEALTRGDCDPELAHRTRMRSVAVADKEAAPEMAARAAQLALSRAGARSDQIVLVLYASLYMQGHHLWAPASYVQRVAVGNACPAMEVRQVSNGGMAALEVARAYLTSAPENSAVLIATGDRMSAPGFDRWRSDPGTVYADGGTALIVSRGAGFAAIRSLVTVSDPLLEGMHRGGDPFGEASSAGPVIVDLSTWQREYVVVTGQQRTVGRIAAGQRAAVEGALDAAGIGLGDVARVALPHMGWRRLRSAFITAFGWQPEITTWPWSSTVGHLGAGDPFAGLEHLVATGALGPGDHCLLASVGAGFSWSCAVVEILTTPPWGNAFGRKEKDR